MLTTSSSQAGLPSPQHFLHISVWWDYLDPLGQESGLILSPAQGKQFFQTLNGTLEAYAQEKFHHS